MREEIPLLFVTSHYKTSTIIIPCVHVISDHVIHIIFREMWAWQYMNCLHYFTQYKIKARCKEDKFNPQIFNKNNNNKNNTKGKNIIRVLIIIIK